MKYRRRIFTLFLIFMMAPALGVVENKQQGNQVVVDFQKVVGKSPALYGVNGWWTDQDSALWSQRYEQLNLNAVRLAMPHSNLEPVNDDADPNKLNRDGFLFDRPQQVSPDISDRTFTYTRWLSELNRQELVIVVYFPYLAPWLSRDPIHGDLIAPFPPNDLEEYGEFVEASLRFLISEVGFPQERVIVDAVNEPDLACGEDPSTPCFWADGWTEDDLLGVLRVTREAIETVAPNVRVLGLSECCGTVWTQNVLEGTSESSTLDLLSFHSYTGSGFDLDSVFTRADEITSYGRPVILNEYGSLDYRSLGEEGALWHSNALADFWKAGLAPFQYPVSEWLDDFPGEPYNSMGLMENWEDDWTLRPAYPVYAGFYRRFGGRELISITGPEGLVLLASRNQNSLYLWVVNTGSQDIPQVSFEMSNYPVSEAVALVYDNLRYGRMVGAYDGLGTASSFTLDIPARSSYAVEIHPGDLFSNSFLPLITRP